MKIEIFGEPKPKEDVLRLKLVSEYGTIKLVSVDETGVTVSAGYILSIDATGVSMYNSVGISGIAKGSSGSVAVRNERD